MFTGIIENLSEIKEINKEGDNLSISLISKITNELKIDQSLSHNGVCLTVVDINDNIYKVTAIKETILKSSIKNWRIGDVINIERAMKLGEAIYKSQQKTKPDSKNEDGKDNEGKKDDNVVDADFEEVKDENKEKSA